MKMTENNSDDAADAWGTIGEQVEQTKVARMPVERYASEYNMSHSKRGFALIFNHEIFEIPSLKQRAGTNVDCDNLCKALAQMHFDVKLYNDLRLREMMQRIKEVSKWDHSDEDCILIAILSHGEMGYIYARDCQYKLDNIWGYFTATQCPTLAGKPKLFFIQACQGDQLDAGVTLINRTETDSGDYSMSYKIPIHADFLIAYSTIPVKALNHSINIRKKIIIATHRFFVYLKIIFIAYATNNGVASTELQRPNRIVKFIYVIKAPLRGYTFAEALISIDSTRFYSWRNTTKGSWFMQSLCHELLKNGKKYDILTLLTFVCQRVAVDFESNSPDNPNMHQQKQIPCITTMLTRILRFTDK